MSIAKTQNRNVGGIVSLQYAKLADVASFPGMIFFRPVNIFEIVLKTGCRWEDMYFTPQTARPESSSKTDEAGTVYDNTINFVFPSDSDLVAQQFSDLEHTALLIKAVCANGSVELYGTAKNPAWLTYSKTKGAKIMDSAKYDVTISAKSIFPAIPLII